MNKLKQARNFIARSENNRANNLKHVTVWFDDDYGAVVFGDDINPDSFTYYDRMKRKEKASVIKSLLMQAVDKAFNVYPKKNEVKGGPMLCYKEGEFNPDDVVIERWTPVENE